MPEETTILEIIPEDLYAFNLLCGVRDENLLSLETRIGVKINTPGEKILITGNYANATKAFDCIEKLLLLAQKGESIDFLAISKVMDTTMPEDTLDTEIENAMADVIAITAKGRRIKCKTVGQRRYVSAIKENTVTFAIGPAGTGKTYLAMALAVVAFKNKEIEKIILTRPAVEAGEKLGFLPGDLQNKVDPYLRPLYDALYDFMGADGYKRLSERGVVEVAPLAYMRGRTLSNAFIILDEAQNCTIEQMKMFLTRFGEGSKVAITGDVTQTDLPIDKRSGLTHAAKLLKNIKGIEVIHLTNKDVVRHRLVADIIAAYEKTNDKQS